MKLNPFDPEIRSALYVADILESAGLIAGKPERRLLGERANAPAFDHAAGSRSSDGSGNLSALYGRLIEDSFQRVSLGRSPSLRSGSGCDPFGAQPQAASCQHRIPNAEERK